MLTATYAQMMELIDQLPRCTITLSAEDYTAVAKWAVYKMSMLIDPCGLSQFSIAHVTFRPETPVLSKKGWNL